MTQNFNPAWSAYRRAIDSADANAVACDGNSLSYRELAERAGRVAACLADACRAAREQRKPPRVALLASRSIGACVGALGACWAGAAYVPIGLKQPQQRILDLIAQCGPCAIITDDAGAQLLGDALLNAAPALIIHAGREPLQQRRRRIVELAALAPAALAEPAFMAAADIAYIIFTSGSTGAPKGVMIPAGALRQYVGAVSEVLGLRASDRVLGISELSFDVSAHNMFATWEAGAALHVLPAGATLNAVRFAREFRLTVWNSVPSMAGMLRQVKALAPECLPDLRVTAFGGEALPASIVAAWRAAAPHSAIFNVYGPTEATIGCLAQEIGEPMPLTPGRDVIAIGHPFPGTEARIADAHGQALPDGMPGELVLAGAQLAAGYLGNPELTSQRFPVVDGKRCYRTGDYALRDAAGRIHCLGRIDNQVKILGYRIELDEIDAHLRIASGIDMVSSVAWPLLQGTAHGIVAFVGAESIDHGALLGALKASLPAYMVPHRVLALPALPLNPSGKVDRQALQQLLASPQA